VSSHVAVPPMICIVIYTHNCDLSIPSHYCILSRGGVHKSILKTLIILDVGLKILISYSNLLSVINFGIVNGKSPTLKF
jgi:hypothetical protein